MAFKWYVVHTLSGQEKKVKANIEGRVESEETGDLIKQILIPTENVSEVKGGKKTISTRLFFPGYLLIEMEMNEETWHLIRRTTGVLGFLGDSTTSTNQPWKAPPPLLDEEVESILSQVESKKEKVKPKVMFEVGETIKVTEGPFVNFSGIVNEIYPDKGKLKVMVSIFGRSTPLELEYWQVERT